MNKYSRILPIYSTLHLNLFCLKIPLMFTSIVTHTHLIKKCHNQTGNFATCRVFNERFNHVSFSNNMSMTKLRK